MKNISLNFFGEKVTINMPTTLESLRKEISDKFMFNPADAAEVVISYVKDLGKKLIQTEQDFANFISNKIGKLDLDISQTSRLYKENFNTLKKESEENKKLLTECLLKDAELKKKKEETLKEEMNKIEELDKKIQKLLHKKAKLEKKMKLNKKTIEIEQKENSQKIKVLQKKLGINSPKSSKKKPAPKKIVLKNANPTKPKNIPEVHPFSTCDGCKMFPIIGKRYKCKTFPNTHGLKLEAVDTEKIIKEVLLKASSNRINKEGKFIHRMISCEGCGMNPIIGERFKCTVCQKFDYCKSCHELYGHSHGHHFDVIKP